MAAAPQEKQRTTTVEERAPRATASPLDGHAPPTASTRERPGRAIAALVLGIISIPAALFAILGLIIGIVAVVLGATARSDISRRGLEGHGQATAGLILGVIGILLAVANGVAGAIIMG